MNETKQITFTVDLKAAEVILTSLAQQPFAQVAGLIAELQKQASSQIQAEQEQAQG